MCSTFEYEYWPETFFFSLSLRLTRQQFPFGYRTPRSNLVGEANWVSRLSSRLYSSLRRCASVDEWAGEAKLNKDVSRHIKHGLSAQANGILRRTQLLAFSLCAIFHRHLIYRLSVQLLIFPQDVDTKLYCECFIHRKSYLPDRFESEIF